VMYAGRLVLHGAVGGQNWSVDSQRQDPDGNYHCDNSTRCSVAYRPGGVNNRHVANDRDCTSCPPFGPYSVTTRC